MKLQTLRDIPDLNGKRVLVRVDFNTPLNKTTGDIVNDVRIRFALPTIKRLLDGGAKQVILMTHVGRPKDSEPILRTNKMAEKLSELLDKPVAKIDNWGEGGLPEAQIIMLENLRFHPGEKSKDAAEYDAFSKQLASLADVYVNEAFSNSHRKHASMTGVLKYLPGYAGLGVETEVAVISKALESPERPLVAVIAGAKADKLTAIANLINLADYILMGGALAYALRGAQGYKVGTTKVDQEGMSEMAGLVEMIKKSDKVHLPDDAVVAKEFAENTESKVVDINHIEDGWMALDIGPKTIEAYRAILLKAKTVLWFGPLGVFEWAAFKNGTQNVGRAIAESGAVSIVGGGDSATAVQRFGLADKMTHVSTGGGASLQMIEGKPLPAIEALKR